MFIFVYECLNIPKYRSLRHFLRPWRRIPICVERNKRHRLGNAVGRSVDIAAVEVMITYNI